MRSGTETPTPEPVGAGRRPEPRWLTLTDLAVIVAGVALVLTLPWRASGWPPYLPPPPPLFALTAALLRMTMGLGPVLALVILGRRGRYGGPVRPGEWLGLGLAALALQNVAPNLDEAVNAYYRAVGSTKLDFGSARWLLSAPAVLGLLLVVAGLIALRRPAREGSRVASALTVVGIVGGWFLWFWGPCEAARLELPWLLVPNPAGDPAAWGLRAPLVIALREVVAQGLTALTWGLPTAAVVRSWWDDRRLGRSYHSVWTERTCCAVALTVALQSLAFGHWPGGPQAPFGPAWRVSWLACVGLVSWWATGRFAAGRDRPRTHAD